MCGGSSDPTVLRRASYPALGERLDGRKILFEKDFRCGLHRRQQVGIPDQVSDPHVGEPGLSRAQELAGTAQLQVAPRNFEAIVGLADDLETGARDLAEWVAV